MGIRELDIMLDLQGRKTSPLHQLFGLETPTGWNNTWLFLPCKSSMMSSSRIDPYSGVLTFKNPFTCALWQSLSDTRIWLLNMGLSESLTSCLIYKEEKAKYYSSQ